MIVVKILLRIGVMMNIYSWESVFLLINKVGVILWVGLIDVLVNGIFNKWIKINVKLIISLVKEEFFFLFVIVMIIKINMKVKMNLIKNVLDKLRVLKLFCFKLFKGVLVDFKIVINVVVFNKLFKIWVNI